MEFNIKGIPTEIEMYDIDIDEIDLDQNNPRIGFWIDNQLKTDLKQAEIAFALRENFDAIRKLKFSIEANEGILEPIWVVKRNARYLVIDGNTRVEIYRDLRRKYPNKNAYHKIKCKVLPENTPENALDYIRLIAHLRGVNDWDVYERARLLYILWQIKGYTEEELMGTTKLTITQIRNWVNAYKEMTEQFLPDYGSQSDALTKFSYFVEFQNPKIKNGMDINGMNLKNFCKWVGEGEIKKAQDVRNLKEIFNDKTSTEILKKKGYKFAIEQLSKINPGFSSKLFDNIEEVISELKNMTRFEEEEILEGDNMQKKKLLIELYNEVGKIVKRIG